MEEEKDYSTQGTTRNGPVRPSMVTLTGKLLNVSEGIAAMNIRIALGVAFCCVLLVATFIVNILAFDYAKDNKVQGGALTDKNTGAQLTVTPSYPLTHVRFGADEFSGLESFNADLSNGKAFYRATAKEIRPCDESDDDNVCCVNGLAYLIFTGNPASTMCAIDIASNMVFREAEPGFVARCLAVPAGSHRHLLQFGDEMTMGGPPTNAASSVSPSFTSNPTFDPNDLCNQHTTVSSCRGDNSCTWQFATRWTSSVCLQSGIPGGR